LRNSCLFLYTYSILLRYVRGCVCAYMCVVGSSSNINTTKIYNAHIGPILSSIKHESEALLVLVSCSS